jgi:hypothetical protein
MEHAMTTNSEEKNETLVLEAFDTLFNKRDCKAAEKYWSRNYIQHSAHIPPGRDGLFNLIRGAPASMHYEPGLIIASGDHVIVHADFRNRATEKLDSCGHRAYRRRCPRRTLGCAAGDEVTRAGSQSGLPMFGERFRNETSMLYSIDQPSRDIA